MLAPDEVWGLVRAAGSELDIAIFLTAAFTGLRMGELLALFARGISRLPNAHLQCAEVWAEVIALLSQASKEP